MNATLASYTESRSTNLSNTQRTSFIVKAYE